MNNYTIGGTIVDDVWVGKWLQLNPAAIAASGTYTVDLVSVGYLPQNDNYDYEILLSSWVWTPTAAGNQNTTIVYSGPDTSAPLFIHLNCIVTRVKDYSCIQGNSCILPLLNGNKKICFRNSVGVAYSSWGIQFSGYRRLGTNA